MKKVTAIAQEKDSYDTVADLRTLGVLHVEHQQAPQGKDINLLQDDLTLVNTALDVFRQAGVVLKDAKPTTVLCPDWRPKARQHIELWKRYEHLEAYSRTLMNAVSEWEPWGDFDPHQFKELLKRGIFVRLFQVPTKQINEFPQGIIVKTICNRAGNAYCVTVARQPFVAPFKEISLPRQSLSVMRQRLEEDKKVMAGILTEIHKEKSSYGEFLSVQRQLNQDIEFARVLNGMGKEGGFAYVTGYAPADKMEALSKKAHENSWGFLVEEPTKAESVPTLLRNPRWAEIISPVFKLLEIIPGYRELDISPLFLIFLSLFFGMIIGDAGYGLVYFLLTLYLQKKFAAKIKDARIFSLFYLFSACAIFWGVITGTVFGQEWYIKAGLKPLIPILNDTKFLQAFCFFLGAFHLTLGHGWQAIRKMPSLTALADIGWISVLWAAFFLAKTLILNDPFPFFGKWLVIGGLSLVIFCTSPQRNLFKMAGQGLGAVALSLVNNFTDVVSYVRLFAVGLAGVAIADTVNALAAGFGSSNPVAKILIIFLGHSVNIILGPMSVMVHGIRLNVLEFSGHAGLSWSGIAYKPLKE